MSAITQAIGIVAALTVVPPLLFGISIGIPERRKAKRLEAAGALFGEEIEPERPGILLRFEARQRAWIRRQVPFLAAFPLFCWVFFVYFSSGLLPQYVGTDAATQPLALRVWWSYLYQISNNGLVYAIFSLVACGIAVIELMGQARFLRTRPVSMNFLFFTRIGTLIAALIASLVTAAALSFALSLAVYGPVSKHLADDSAASAAMVASAPSQPGPSAGDVMMSVRGENHLLWAAQTSLPRLFLSIVTTMVLLVSIFIMLTTVPVPGKILRIIFIVGTVYVVLGIYISYVDLDERIAPAMARDLFLYTHPGPAPPLSFALVPVAISAVLLALAGIMNRRYEG